MNGYLFFRSMQAMLAAGLLVLLGLFACVACIVGEISKEVQYRNKHGENWRVQYERVHGPVYRAHNRIGIAAVGIVAIVGVSIWLGLVLKPKEQRAFSWEDTERRRHVRQSSGGDGFSRYRRRAVLGIVSGLVGILAGICLALFRFGIFASHSDEMLLGTGVFLGGYVAVMYGCWWWLKAKEWNEAVVLIGLLPVTVIFIPFVRLIYVAVPELLPVSMAMATLILIVVVMVLPDKSRRQREWWARKRKRRDREATE
jgi:hypothetical protein